MCSGIGRASLQDCGAMSSDQLLMEQRRLRTQFFEGPGALRWRPARELAAQLLLYLDDPAACWRLTAEWLRDTLDADRVDAGFGGTAGQDYVVLTESQRPALGLPTMLGRRIAADELGLRSLWASPGVLMLPCIREQPNISAPLRHSLQTLGTASKLAMTVRSRRPIGMICADWQHDTPRWHPDTFNEMRAFTQQVVAPVLEVALTLATPATACGVHAGRQGDALLAELTPAERNVARLVAMGLSYKEVARRLDRSLATIDHQLRSIRAKLGVSSTARLVRLLNHGTESPGPQHTRGLKDF